MTHVIIAAAVIFWSLALVNESRSAPRNIFIGLTGMKQGQDNANANARKAWDTASEIAEDLRSQLGAPPPVKARAQWNVQTDWRQLSQFDFFVIGRLQPGGDAVEKYWITWQVGQIGQLGSTRAPLFVGDLIVKTKFTFSSNGPIVEVGKSADIAASVKQILPGLRPPKIYFVHCFRGPVSIQGWDELNPQMTREIWERLRDKKRGLEPATDPNTYDQPDFQKDLCANRLQQIDSLRKKADYILSSRLESLNGTHAVVNLEINNQVAQRRESQVEAPSIDPESDLGKLLQRAAELEEPDPIEDKKFCIDLHKLREPNVASSEARKFAEYIIMNVLSRVASGATGNTCP
jgi:hypothetical protein